MKMMLCKTAKTVRKARESRLSSRIGSGTMTHACARALLNRSSASKGCEHTSIYRTPNGNIDLSVRTRRCLSITAKWQGASTSVYGLWVNGAFQSQNRLHIEIEEDHGL